MTEPINSNCSNEDDKSSFSSLLSKLTGSSQPPLYHGLGSGKTCSTIGYYSKKIMEVNDKEIRNYTEEVNDKEIRNYMKEMKKYMKNDY